MMTTKIQKFSINCGSDYLMFFLHIMNFVHKNGTLHNDLSSQNILLHREGENMYIGV